MQSRQAAKRLCMNKKYIKLTYACMNTRQTSVVCTTNDDEEDERIEKEEATITAIAYRRDVVVVEEGIGILHTTPLPPMNLQCVVLQTFGQGCVVIVWCT